MRLSIILIVVLSACQAPKSVNQPDKQTEFIQIAESQLGASAQCVKNSSETMVLCINESVTSPQQPRNNVTFMVIKLDDSSTIYESSVDGGNVKWFDDERLEIFTVPGYMKQGQTNDDYTKIYDLNTQEMTPKTEYLNR